MLLSWHFTRPPRETAFVQDNSAVVSGSVARCLAIASKLVLTQCCCFFANLAATAWHMATDGCPAADAPALGDLVPGIEDLEDLEPALEDLGPGVEALEDLSGHELVLRRFHVPVLTAATS